MKIKMQVVICSLLLASCVAPTPQIIVVTATPMPSAIAEPTAHPVTLWVCVDLAYGYESGSEQSRVVWRMTKRDGWAFTGPSNSSPWIPITIEDGRSAFMRRADLCENPPASAGAAPQASDCPKGCEVPPLGCLIKGNISPSAAEKIYHLPGQKYYASTVIEPSLGERWFCTEAEAIANGWRKSRE